MVDPDVETVDLPGGVAPQGFSSESDEEGVMPKFFDMSALTEGKIIYYTSPESTNMFHPK